jgi:hypothetical protein
MATFCYTWDNADVFWNTVELTWAEFCVVDKAIGVVGGGPNRRLKKELTDEEQQTIIDLFVRIKEQDVEFEKRMNKHKNKKAKVTIKDVEMLLREAKKIDVKIFM